VLVEHYAGAFPPWLAPVQVVVLPISEKHEVYAREVVSALKASRLRVELDDRNEKLNARIRDAQLAKAPFMLVVGEREAASRSVSVRRRNAGDTGTLPLEDFIKTAREVVDSHAVKW